MNIEEYHKMHALEKNYWWFQARRKMIRTLLAELVPKCRVPADAALASRPALRILDIGCGTGMLMEDLQAYGWVAGLDFSPVALAYCRERRLPNLARADVQRLPVRSNSVDLLTALDLVEHVEDDRKLMGEIHRVLRPGGYALMSVPAHKRLWSNHDVALHHFRRYEKSEFRQLVLGAGLEIEKCSYMMASIYWPAAIYRRLKKHFLRPSASPKTDEFPLPVWVNALLRAVVSAEAPLLRRYSMPCGLSIVCIARKPA
ncbi:S-adenosylmethionine-dependent methyltransferase [Candidatus Sumerlaea chitinivorans]|uniref:S-adenosylmethionine-dependent methyltransferase n=1 Tax=Sumerlaea chitinivorans TaxID=2250252 RepID=A0A2Z4Y5P0_SUMC1|nr:S-adenosylmethionine-dependent methyltransferase [Candidatus Sumerlaea chitinivorans]